MVSLHSVSKILPPGLRMAAHGAAAMDPYGGTVGHGPGRLVKRINRRVGPGVTEYSQLPMAADNDNPTQAEGLAPPEAGV